MSVKCKHGVRDTETNLPYCRRCDAEGKAHMQTNSKQPVKLRDILKEITPLPWPSSADHDDAPDFEHQPNWDYARHAANILPALVNTVREYMTERTYQNVSACKKDQDRLEKLLLAELSKAEEVEMEND